MQRAGFLRLQIARCVLAGLAVLTLGVGHPVAQVPERAEADTSGVAGDVEGGLSLGYDTMLREYSTFRPRTAARPDTTALSARAVAEAVARLATTRAAAVDGVRRLEVDGLVADQTITRIGREFYLQFYRLWAPPPEAVAFTVEVVEQPDRGINTVVRVLVNDELVFQTRLSPRADDAVDEAERAVAAAYRRLQRRDSPSAAY